MKVLVCGGRSFNNRGLLTRTLCALKPWPTLIVHGAANGADALAGEWARWYDVPCVSHCADWHGLGKAAGPTRNQLMLDQEKPELVVAFPGGPGTADMVRRAEKAGVRVLKVTANKS